MAPELSGNWKKLQAKIQAESTAPATKKRAAEPDQRRLNSIAKKRRLENAANPQDNGRQEMPVVMANPEPSRPQDKSNSRSTDPQALEQWAKDNDIDAADLALAYGPQLGRVGGTTTHEDVVNGGLSEDVEIGMYVAMDCEMVGVGGEEDRSVLARVSLVNFHGQQIYDSFVRPKEFVTNWRTSVSGVAARDMAKARSLEEVQATVEGILKDRVLVGHAVRNDLEALMLSHPRRDIRDTQRFEGFRRFGRYPRLRLLAKELLGLEIQSGAHSSIEDARTTMLLYRKHKAAFEAEHARKWLPNGHQGKKAKRRMHGKHA